MNHTLRASLNADELLWPMSLPPILPEDLTKIELSHVTEEKANYYKNWLKNHDIRRALPTGVHINISFDAALIDSLHAYTLEGYPTKPELKNALFEKIVHGFIQYRWLLTYLFGASPVAERNYYVDQVPESPVRSLRSSRQYGLFSAYRDDYRSIAAYESSLLKAISDNEIQSESEFHGPIRLKAADEIKGMADKGLSYIELRMLDLDPSSSIGIRASTVRFLRLLTMYFVMTPDTWQNNSQKIADQMNETVALEPAKSMTLYQTQALAFMSDLEEFSALVGLSTKVKSTIKELHQRVKNSSLTLSAQLNDLIVNHSLVDYAIARAQMYQDFADNEVKHLRVYKKSINGQEMSEEELRVMLFDQPWRHVEYPEYIE